MDPTLFLASNHLSTAPNKDTVQEFYNSHSATPFYYVRALVRRALNWANRKPKSAPSEPRFAVSHPAE